MYLAVSLLTIIFLSNISLKENSESKFFRANSFLLFFNKVKSSTLKSMIGVKLVTRTGF